MADSILPLSFLQGIKIVVENFLFSSCLMGLAMTYWQRHNFLKPGSGAKYRLTKLLNQGIFLGTSKRKSDLTA
jgi:hypothetical protein